MPNIRIKVGAVGDASLASVFTTMVDASKRARAQIEAELTKMSASMAAQAKKGAASAAASTEALPKAMRKSVSEADKAYADLVRDIEGKGARMMAPGTAAIVKFARDARQHFDATKRSFAEMARDAERSMGAISSPAASRVGRDARGGGGGGSSALGWAGGVAGRVASLSLSAGTRIAGDLVRGVGVNTDAGSMFSSGVDLEKRATDLSNAAYMPGKSGAAGSRQDPKTLIAEVRAASDGAAISTDKAMEGLQAFVAKTGDLETGRNVLAEMAKLSRATGASMEDMTNAAGDVANGLGDVPDKAGKVAEVMRAAAAMGKEGAVEIKDLASQMAKLQAAAGQFGGDKTRNMNDMVALAQISRSSGGSASATQAATSVAAFTSTFDKSARLDKFDKYGVKVKGEDGQTRRSIDIILDALRATGGDSRKMGEMFASEGTKRVSRGVAKAYHDAGGGEAGLAAAKAAFDQIADAVMKQKEVTESLGISMATAESKVQLFNNKMEATADEVRINLMPALVALAPSIISSTKAIADWIGKVTGKTEADEKARAEAATKAAGGALAPVDAALAKGVTTTTASGVPVLHPAELDENDQAMAQAAEKKLRDAISEKKKRMSQQRNDLGFNAWGRSIWDGDREETTRKQAAQGDKTAASYVENQGELAKMEGMLDKLHASNVETMERALSGALRMTTLKVVEQNRPTAQLPAPNPGATLSPKVVHE